MLLLPTELAGGSGGGSSKEESRFIDSGLSGGKLGGSRSGGEGTEQCNRNLDKLQLK